PSGLTRNAPMIRPTTGVLTMIRSTRGGNIRSLYVASALTIAFSGGSAASQTPARGRAASPGAPLVLDRETTILVGADEPAPIAAAARDLAADCEKVLGRAPRIVQRPEDAAAATIVIGFRSTLVQGVRPTAAGAPESFSLSVRDAAWKGAPRRRAVVLTGADMRGTMYAVYQFAEEFLGVDPLYYWTDHVPARRATIEVPASLSEAFPAPVFKYRGFFINDEDLLTGWASGERN